MESQRLQESLLLHAELEDIEKRLVMMEAMYMNGWSDMWSTAKNAYKGAKEAVSHAKNAVVTAMNKVPDIMPVANEVHNAFKVTPAISGNQITATINGREVVLIRESETNWKVKVGSSEKNAKKASEIISDLKTMTSVSAIPAPTETSTEASFEEILRHSRTIMRCKPVQRSF